MTAPSPHVVYDNTTTDLDWSVGGGPPGGFGSQIRLAGKARVVTEFLFGYNGDADVKVTLKYHENDGPKGGPGTVFFDSGESAIDGGLADKTFSGLKVFVPDTFIWTVSWTGPKTGGFGLTGFYPATIGKSGQLWDWPDYVGPPPRPGWEKYDYNHPGGLRARITAVTSPVHPGWDGVIVAQILAGVINDGGGWIKVAIDLFGCPRANRSSQCSPHFHSNSRNDFCQFWGRRHTAPNRRPAYASSCMVRSPITCRSHVADQSRPAR
jgi:hypothetical protein